MEECFRLLKAVPNLVTSVQKYHVTSLVVVWPSGGALETSGERD